MLRRMAVWRCAATPKPPVLNVSPSMPTMPTYNAPIMSFLADPKAIVDTVEPTLKACQGLEAALKKPGTPQEKHDIIDSMSNILCLLVDPCEFMRQIHPDPKFRTSASEAFMQGAQYMAEANSKRDLYDVVKEITEPENFAKLNEESQKNITQMKRDMEINGIHLGDKARAKIVQLNMEKDHLAGEFLNGQKNPFATLRNLVICRHELATSLGFECFAEQQLKGCMLDNPQKVWHFLCAVGNKYRPPAEVEMHRLRNQLGEVKSRSGVLTDEDRAKLAHSIQRQYQPIGIDKYFTVANCIRGMQLLCEEVFGMKVKPVPLDDEELSLGMGFKKFHVFDEKNDFVGVIVVDMFARKDKHCQAGHMSVQLGCRPHNAALAHVGLNLGERQYPVVVLTCNAGALGSIQFKGDGMPDEETTTMVHSEVTTFFHEFGHALHTLLGQTTVQNLAGTRGTIDFVECFSQFFELFLNSHDFLKLWALRTGTREPIPIELVQQRNDVSNMFRHLDAMDQVLLASIDQSLHGPQPFTVYFPTAGGQLGKRTLGTPAEYGRGIYNLAKLMLDMCHPISVVNCTERGVLRSLSFEHLAAYPAGYYGYLYSNAFAKRIFAKNFADKPLNRIEGQRLAKEVMCHGAACNSKQVMAAYLKEDIDDIESWI